MSVDRPGLGSSKICIGYMSGLTRTETQNGVIVYRMHIYTCLGLRSMLAKQCSRAADLFKTKLQAKSIASINIKL